MYGEYVVCFSFRMVFFYLVTTGWIFDTSLLCENSINIILFVCLYLLLLWTMGLHVLDCRPACPVCGHNGSIAMQGQHSFRVGRQIDNQILL